MGRGYMPLALAPFVSLADLAGISTQITMAIVDLFGGVLETDSWRTVAALDESRPGGLTIKEVIRHVTEGEEE